jgi:hypothetical protein
MHSDAASKIEWSLPAAGMALILAAMALGTPLALLSRSKALHLRGLPNPSQLLQGQLTELSTFLFVIVAVAVLSKFMRHLLEGLGATVYLCAACLLGIALTARLQFDSDILLLVCLYTLGVVAVAVPHLLTARLRSAALFSLPGVLVVFAMTWAALFLE